MRNLKSIIFQPILLSLLLSVGVHAVVLHQKDDAEAAPLLIKKDRTIVQLSLQQPEPAPTSVLPQPEPPPKPPSEPAPPVIKPTPEPEIMLPEPEAKHSEPEIAELEPAAKPPESVPLPLSPVALPAEPASVLPPEIGESSETAIAAPKKTGNTTAARLLGEFKPEYPSFSKRKNEEGRVQLLLQILADGSVGTVKILSSSGSSRLDKAAQNAAKKCRYAPARDENDRPIESTANLSYIFKLNNE